MAKYNYQHPLYKRYRGMIDRCFNPANWHYHNYGGRGVSVCDRWLGEGGFERFCRDVGLPPSDEHTLDRRENDGNYDPENTRWATRTQQNNNTRKNVKVTHDGLTLTVAEWSRITGLSKGSIWRRLNSGWTGKEALTTQKNGRRPSSRRGRSRFVGVSIRKACFIAKGVKDRVPVYIGCYKTELAAAIAYDEWSFRTHVAARLNFPERMSCRSIA